MNFVLKFPLFPLAFVFVSEWHGMMEAGRLFFVSVVRFGITRVHLSSNIVYLYHSLILLS